MLVACFVILLFGLIVDFNVLVFVTTINFTWFGGFRLIVA